MYDYFNDARRKPWNPQHFKEIMSSAFTVRLRVLASGAHVMSIAPAAGFGFSSTCCADGHQTESEAVSHGLQYLKTSFEAVSHEQTLSA